MSKKTKQISYLTLGVIGCMWIIIVRFALPFDAIPFLFEEFLFFKGALWEPFAIALPLFIAAMAINLYKMVTTVNPPEVQKNAPMIPLSGFSLSVMAGVLEEIVFRWVLVYAVMGILWTANVILDGLLEQINQYPVYQNLTRYLVGNATHILEKPGAWTLLLAALASNWKFQRGHIYMGPVGAIFSWFAGWAFFSITFQHGLLAAMLVHFCLDMMVFLMLFTDVLMENAMGLKQQAKDRMYGAYRTENQKGNGG